MSLVLVYLSICNEMLSKGVHVRGGDDRYAITILSKVLRGASGLSGRWRIVLLLLTILLRGSV